jgi:thiamine biosynthesis protein ThiI
MKREKVVCLFSGGIDSPAACALVAKYFEIIPLHLCTYPYTSKEMLELTVDSLKKVRGLTKFEKAVICPWAEVMDTIVGGLDRKGYTCLLCKRSMFKTAELLCEAERADGIVTGESLGQKASQTLSNMTAISSGIKFPILRPLLGLDKIEIEKISKEFGVWQARHAGGCRAVPKHPHTISNADELNELFNQLKLDELIRNSLRKAVKIRTFEEDLIPLFLRQQL